MPKGSSGANFEYSKMTVAVKDLGTQTGNEYIGVIDISAGTSIGGHLNTSNLPNEAALSREQMLALTTASANSLDMVHNHPSSSSFSGADLSFAEYAAVRGTTVMAHDGTRYVMVFAGGQRPSGQSIYDAWTQEFNRTQEPYADRIAAGIITYDQARKQHFHEINQTLAKNYGWTYRRY